jgi:acetate kinase
MPPPDGSCILTLNGGSSSIKYALFTCEPCPRRLFDDQIEAPRDDRLFDRIRAQIGGRSVVGIGHRVVHGGVHLDEHRLIDADVLDELRRSIPLDLAHLPAELELIEAAQRAFMGVPQIACFDTQFHRNLPGVAKLLAIPRRFTEAGVRRLGFHGLSFAYLLEELRRVGKSGEADGRVILAHLGAGASLAAVKGGKPVDTSMAFTPTAGLVMGTRPGDLDPGLFVHMMRTDNLTADQMDDLLNKECGLTGLSGTSADMRVLLAHRSTDPRAAEAIEVFCYQARKWIGAFSAALGGLDTLVFSAGIGEKSPPIRAQICAGFEFLGLKLDQARNAANAQIISEESSRVTVRIIPTDEEQVIARTVLAILQQQGHSHA